MGANTISAVEHLNRGAGHAHIYFLPDVLKWHRVVHTYILPCAQPVRKPCSISPEAMLNLPGGDAQSGAEYSVSQAIRKILLAELLEDFLLVTRLKAGQYKVFLVER